MTEVLDRSTLKALSTETRQEIIKMLSKRPYTASEIAKILNKHVTTITEHLSVLERSNVVKKKESNNKWVYYILTDKGEKFFKPYYSWILVLSVSLVAFVVGFYEVLFVRFQATTMDIGESAYTLKTAAAPMAEAARVVTYDTNLVIGICALVIGLVLLAAVFVIRRSHERRVHELMTQLRLLEER
jgi:DNA-binding transcriptional ArsR family regulator